MLILLCQQSDSPWLAGLYAASRAPLSDKLKKPPLRIDLLYRPRYDAGEAAEGVSEADADEFEFSDDEAEAAWQREQRAALAAQQQQQQQRAGNGYGRGRGRGRGGGDGGGRMPGRGGGMGGPGRFGRSNGAGGAASPVQNQLLLSHACQLNTCSQCCAWAVG
jgi:hypothetical protein